MSAANFKVPHLTTLAVYVNIIVSKSYCQNYDGTESFNLGRNI